MAALVPSTAPVPPPTTSLYVGDLHPDVTEAILVDEFSEFKSLASVRVCRDTSTGRSLCYAYVNFMNEQDAILALKAKNNSILKGKMIRVMWSHRDSDGRKSGIGNLFVKNLCDSIDNSGLQDIFLKFGDIVSCKVATLENGKSKGYGFVQFKTEDSAKAAIGALNGSTVAGKQIHVGKFVKKSDRVLPSPDAIYTNLYMKNLDTDITEEVLHEKFSQFGNIVSLVISKDDNGTSRGFGFVNFDNPDDAKQAQETMNGSELGSKILYVARAQKKAERDELLQRSFEDKRKDQVLKYKGANLFVKNIDDDVTEEELREHFSVCGTITSATLMLNEKGIKKGFGFVCFSNSEEATKAVSTFHGTMFHRKPLYVAIAQKKKDRQAHLQLQYSQRMAALAVGSSTNIIPGGYPPIYYPAPGLFPQVPPQPSLMYQTLGLRPTWRPNGFAPPSRPPFQPPPFHLIPSAPRQTRQPRIRMNGHIPQQNYAHSVPYMPHMQPPPHPMPSSKDFTNQQRSGHAKYMPNGHTIETNKGSLAASNSVGAMSQGSDTLSSLLASASPAQQKQILGERLYPLVEKLQPELVAKITGMLLEMDNSELLLLLESPESLAAKVDEAVEVLKMSKNKVNGQEVIHPTYLSSGVGVGVGVN